MAPELLFMEASINSPQTIKQNILMLVVIKMQN